MGGTRGRRGPRRLPSLSLNGFRVSGFGLLVVMSITYVVAVRYDLFDWFVRWSDRNESHQLDELVPVALVGLVGTLVLAVGWNETARRATRELARTTEQFRSLFEYHPHGVIAVGLDGRFKAANAAAERICGWSEDSLRHLAFDDLLHPDSVASTNAAFAEMLQMRPQHVEVTIKHRRGRLVQLSVTGLPIVVGKRVVGIYAIARDVTKHNGILRELRRANVAAERAGEAKSAFLANISHEIRTPLTSLLTASELLADTELDPLQESVVETLNRAGQRLQRLVDNVLDFSKLEAGKMELEIVDFDVRALIEDAAAMFVHVAERKGVHVHSEVATVVPAVLAGDPARISQVLNNLLSNAVKFTAEGDIHLRVTVSEADESHVELTFSVTDAGIGMSADQRGRLFQSFTQADPSITRKYGGTGLGLVISRNLVNLMGGTIWATSTPGRGSTFSFRVPFAPASDQVADPRASTRRPGQTLTGPLGGSRDPSGPAAPTPATPAGLAAAPAAGDHRVTRV